MSKMINGLSFEISMPYAEGHTINAAEAKALNQTRAENIGNNLRTQIKEAQESGKSLEEITALVAAYDSTYVLSMSQVSASRKLDPVEAEANRLARDLLKDHLAKSGRKLTVTPEGETDESWKEKVQAKIEEIASNEDVISEAKKSVKAKQNRADKLAAAVNLS